MVDCPVQVAILGAGAIAYGNAALLCRNRNDVTLWSPSGQRTATLATGAPLVATGAVAGHFHPRIAASCADALSGAEAVVVAVPGYGHRHVLDAAAPFLRSEQVVVFSSHMSLAALYLAELLRKRGVTTPIAALGTTVPPGPTPPVARSGAAAPRPAAGRAGAGAGQRRGPPLRGCRVGERGGAGRRGRAARGASRRRRARARRGGWQPFQARQSRCTRAA